MEVQMSKQSSKWKPNLPMSKLMERTSPFGTESPEMELHACIVLLIVLVFVREINTTFQRLTNFGQLQTPVLYSQAKLTLKPKPL
jgi:hypothetical protein